MKRPVETLEDAARDQGVEPNPWNTAMVCDPGLTMGQALVCGIRAFAEQDTERGEQARQMLGGGAILRAAPAYWMGWAGRCSQNAATLALSNPGWQKMEGFAVTPDKRVFWHCWCADTNGNLHDPTWPNATECLYACGVTTDDRLTCTAG